MYEQVTMEEAMDRFQFEIQAVYEDMHEAGEFNSSHIFDLVKRYCKRNGLDIIDSEEIDFETLIDNDYHSFVMEAL